MSERPLHSENLIGQPQEEPNKIVPDENKSERPSSKPDEIKPPQHEAGEFGFDKGAPQKIKETTGETERELQGELDENEQYEIMDKLDTDCCENYCRVKVQQWHDRIQPDFIVMSGKSTIPIMHAAREAWRVAYPDEDLPKFLQVYPLEVEDRERGSVNKKGKFTGFGDERDREYQLFKYEEFSEINKNSTILLYDESSVLPIEVENPLHFVKNGRKTLPGEDWGGRSINSMMSYFRKMKFKDIWVDSSQPSYGSDKSGEIVFIDDDRQITEDYQNIRDYRGMNDRYGNFAKMIGEKDMDEEKEKAKKYLHDLKLLGRRAGSKVKESLSKEKKLE